MNQQIKIVNSKSKLYFQYLNNALKQRYNKYKQKINASQQLKLQDKKKNIQQMCKAHIIIRELTKQITFLCSREHIQSQFIYVYQKILVCSTLLEIQKKLQLLKTQLAQHTSHYHKIKRKIQYRQLTFVKIQHYLRRLSSQQILSAKLFDKTIQKLIAYRNQTLQLVEQVMQWKNDLKSMIQEDNQQTINQIIFYQKNQNILETIKKNTLQISTSELENFIEFKQDDLDPFFLHPYKIFTMSFDNLMHKNAAIRRLFDINQQYLDRLKKSHSFIKQQIEVHKKQLMLNIFSDTFYKRIQTKRKKNKNKIPLKNNKKYDTDSHDQQLNINQDLQNGKQEIQIQKNKISSQQINVIKTPKKQKKYKIQPKLYQIKTEIEKQDSVYNDSKVPKSVKNSRVKLPLLTKTNKQNAGSTSLKNKQVSMYSVLDRQFEKKKLRLSYQKILQMKVVQRLSKRKLFNIKIGNQQPKDLAQNKKKQQVLPIQARQNKQKKLNFFKMNYQVNYIKKQIKNEQQIPVQKNILVQNSKQAQKAIKPKQSQEKQINSNKQHQRQKNPPELQKIIKQQNKQDLMKKKKQQKQLALKVPIKSQNLEAIKQNQKKLIQQDQQIMKLKQQLNQLKAKIKKQQQQKFKQKKQRQQYQLNNPLQKKNITNNQKIYLQNRKIQTPSKKKQKYQRNKTLQSYIDTESEKSTQRKKQLSQIIVPILKPNRSRKYRKSHKKLQATQKSQPSIQSPDKKILNTFNKKGKKLSDWIDEIQVPKQNKVQKVKQNIKQKNKSFGKKFEKVNPKSQKNIIQLITEPNQNPNKKQIKKQQPNKDLKQKKQFINLEKQDVKIIPKLQIIQENNQNDQSTFLKIPPYQVQKLSLKQIVINQNQFKQYIIKNKLRFSFQQQSIIKLKDQMKWENYFIYQLKQKKQILSVIILKLNRKDGNRFLGIQFMSGYSKQLVLIALKKTIQKVWKYQMDCKVICVLDKNLNSQFKKLLKEANFFDKNNIFRIQFNPTQIKCKPIIDIQISHVLAQKNNLDVIFQAQQIQNFTKSNYNGNSFIYGLLQNKFNQSELQTLLQSNNNLSQISKTFIRKKILDKLINISKYKSFNQMNKFLNQINFDIYQQSISQLQLVLSVFNEHISLPFRYAITQKYIIFNSFKQTDVFISKTENQSICVIKLGKLRLFFYKNQAQQQITNYFPTFQKIKNLNFSKSKFNKVLIQQFQHQLYGQLTSIDNFLIFGNLFFSLNQDQFTYSSINFNLNSDSIIYFYLPYVVGIYYQYQNQVFQVFETYIQKGFQ